MARVAGIPAELRGVAASLHGTAGDLDALAARLASISYPEMPPATAATVQAFVGDAGSRLRRDAIVAESSGGGVKNRALWFEAADALLAAPASRAPYMGGEAIVNVLDLTERLRVDRMLQEWTHWNRIVPEIVGSYGEDSMAATSIWFSRQEHSSLPYSRFLKMVEGEGDRDFYAGSADVPLTAFRAVAGKVLGPVGIATNAYTIFHPEHSGWRGDVDRASGGIGTVGSIGATALAFGAFVPGLDVAVGAALLGVAAWQLGNLMYDNRAAIARAAVATGNYVYEHAGWIGGPLGQLAWEHRGQAVRAAVSAGTWGADHAESVARTGLGLGKGIVDAGLHPEHTGTKIAHGLGDAAKTVGGLI
jgi:hypothetical protein